MFKVPEQHRLNNPRLGGPFASTEADGNNGIFWIPHYRIRNYMFYCQVSDGLDQNGKPAFDNLDATWEHVSVSVGQKGKKQSRNPTWEEMCWIKDQFWDEEDRVIQFHPPKSEYVSLHPYTLHLWRKADIEFPHPPSILVGPDAAKK